jgi:hypothetical protein
MFRLFHGCTGKQNNPAIAAPLGSAATLPTRRPAMVLPPSGLSFGAHSLGSPKLEFTLARLWSHCAALNYVQLGCPLKIHGIVSSDLKREQLDFAPR